MNLEPLRNLSPEVIECLGAHVFAVEWLVHAIYAGDFIAGLENKDLARVAREQGYAAYIAASPADTLEILDKALNDYIAIVQNSEHDLTQPAASEPPAPDQLSGNKKSNSDENPDFSAS